MTRADATALYAAIVAELAAKGLALPPGWSLAFDARAVRRFGQCCYRRFGGGEIALSVRLVELNDEKAVGATIRHEIAHALVGPKHGHDWVWREMALKCGDDGRRCYSDEEVVTPPRPFVARCPSCDKEFGAARLPKRFGWCPKCNGRKFPRFSPAHVLSFVPNAAIPVREITTTTMPASVGADQIETVLRLRRKGLGYVAIDAHFGIHGKKGWWSWRIVKAAGK